VVLPEAKSTDVWEDLVISMLSVNSCSIEKVYPLRESLRTEGLFDPLNLAKSSHEDIASRLERAGYNRGTFMTALLSLRLLSLGLFLESRSVAGCAEILASGDTGNIASLLSQVSGIGPKVLSNFFLLRGMASVTLK
jgi:hypothetical protein